MSMIMFRPMKEKIIITICIASVLTSSYAQTSDDNYTKTIEMLTADGTDSTETIQYFDNFGRLIETVTNTANGKMLHSLNEYDSNGRVARIWNSIATHSKSHIEAEEFKSLSSAQYNDSYAFSSTTYDVSGRPLFISSSGEAWKGKGQSYIYGSNKENEVKLYSYNDINGASYYPASTLTSVTTINEDGQMMTTYKDLSDNIVLERRTDGNQNFDTYYVYDDDYHLRYILQPMYQSHPDLDLYAFCYEYDEMGRVSKKTLPGCKPVSFWYDQADRVIKMQDGVLSANGKYRKYEYDGLGRLTKQSLYNDDDTYVYDEIVNFYDTYDYLKDPNYAHMVPANHVDTTSLCPIRPEYGNGQLTGTWQRASNGENMLMSYNYDDHGRLTMTKEIGLDKHLAVVYQDYNFNGAILSEHKDLYRYDKMENALNDNTLYGTIKHYFTASNNKRPYRSVIRLTHKGSTTQTKDEIMKPTYDDFCRVIANDRKGTAGDMTFAYDNLHGWLTRSTSASGFEQTLLRETGADNPRWNGSISAMTWEVGDGKKHTYQYTYDGLNRLTEAVYSSNLDIYDKLRPSKEPSRGTDLSELKGSEPFRLIPMERLQGNYSESYSYDKNSNIEWLQRNGTTNTGKGKSIDVLEYSYSGNQLKSVTDYSEEELNYAGAFDFQDKADTEQEYAYNENGAMTKDLNKGITNIEYDLLGNPRKVTFSGKNSIEYVYAADGRKLREVHSLTIRAVVPVITDPRRPGNGLGSQKIGKGTDPKGQEKLVYYTFRDSTDYINNYVFKNGKPEMFRFPGGYYSFDEEGKMDGCHLYVQDYQGNNRMVVNAYTNEVEQINHYYPYGALMGDISTQPEKQDFKYSGKELDRTYGLDLHDFEARQQDPLVGRFTSIDPMAEKYYWLSPYAYCAGDPINLVDPTGMDIVYMLRGGYELKRYISDQNVTYVQDANSQTCELENIGENGGEGWVQAAMPDAIDGYSSDYDYLIAAETAYFNMDKNNGITPTHTNGETIDDVSTVPDLDPTLVKGIIANESAMGTIDGKKGQNAKQDIMQANVPGDWNDSKTQFGLEKNGSATPELSVYAGIRILYQKGLNSEYRKDGTLSTTFLGWNNAAKDYNGGGDKFYMKKLLNKIKK